MLKIFTTGGTIDKCCPIGDYFVSLPTVNFQYEIESIIQKDSLNITNEDRILIQKKIENEPSRHIIITHGTDTIARTGRFLRSSTKTVVLTGSFIPGHYNGSDAHFNIGYAVATTHHSFLPSAPM